MSRQTTKHNIYVSDRAHRGKRLALRKAIAERERLQGRLPPPIRLPGLSRSNTTGVVGVAYTKDRTKAGRLTYRYVANWYAASGEYATRRFSELKYGKDEAFRRACVARREGVRERLAHSRPNTRGARP